MISIHALLAESDLGNVVAALPMLNFYPRSPCGERHDLEPSSTRKLTFLSTLSLRRATGHHRTYSQYPCISIHALLAESDCQAWRGTQRHKISIHALLAESDRQLLHGSESKGIKFLSTLSLRRATLFSHAIIILVLKFLSTLSLRRATRFLLS